MCNICVKLDNQFIKSFDEQLAFLSELNINNIEIDDYIDNLYLINMNGEQIEKYRNILIKYNKKIVLINSSISLDNISDYHLLFRKAHLLKAESIRLHFDSNCIDTLLFEKVEEILKMGKSYNIWCMIENNAHLFNADALMQTQLFSKYKEYHLGLIYNALEVVKQKRHPFFHVFYNGRFKNNIQFLRINDGLFSDGSPIMIGNGNAEIKELISALLARNYKGYFSIEPYLAPCDVNDIIMTLDIFKKTLMEI